MEWILLGTESTVFIHLICSWGSWGSEAATNLLSEGQAAIIILSKAAFYGRLALENVPGNMYHS